MRVNNLIREFGVILLATAMVSGAYAGKTLKNLRKVPEWVLQADACKLPEYDEEVKFVRVHDSMTTRVEADGVKRIQTRYAIRILDAAGFEAARAYVSYSEDTDKVESFAAWVVTPEGTAISYGKHDIMDRASRSAGQIAGSGRHQVIDASRDVKVGYLFAFERSVKDASIFGRQIWYFQGDEPVISSSITLDVPVGWDVVPYFFNTESVDPFVSGTARTWTMKNLPGVKREEMAPQRSECLIWAAFDLFAPESAQPRSSSYAFRSWEQLARESYAQYREQSAGSPELAAKARELVAAAKGELERVSRIASYARSVNYVHVSLELGKGGGFIPRKAAKVFETNWGDCKDKATLLCSMLEEVGVKAYPLIVNAADRDTIYEMWPTGAQFNHCINAISVSEEVEFDTVIDHPSLGRLLVFDPTSEMTAFGDLPQWLQGSKGLLLAGEEGGLIELPVVAPENNVLKRRIQAEVLENGSILAKLSEESLGQAGRRERDIFRSMDRASDYRKRVKSWVSNYAPAAQVSEPVVEDDLETGRFSMEVDFGSPGYGKALGGALVTFRPILLDRRTAPPFTTKEKRTQPLILDVIHLDEVAEIFVPSGFEASELPESLNLSEPFGIYEGRVERTGDKVVATRRLWLKETPIAVEDFEKARLFFEKIVSFEQSPVVLERK